MTLSEKLTQLLIKRRITGNLTTLLEAAELMGLRTTQLLQILERAQTEGRFTLQATPTHPLDLLEIKTLHPATVATVDDQPIDLSKYFTLKDN